MEVLEDVQIKKIYENQTQEGNPYWAILGGDKRITFFDKKQIEKVREGDRATIWYRRSGKYLNGKKIKEVVKGGQPDNGESPGEKEDDRNSLGLKERTIQRQCAAKTAAHFSRKGYKAI